MSILTDSHIHLFEKGFAAAPTATEHEDVTRYDALRARWQINQALVVAYEGDPRFAGNNDYVRRQAQIHPWVRPLAYVDAAADADQVTAYLDQGFVGVSAYVTDTAVAAPMLQALRAAAPVLSERRALLSLNIAPENYPILRELLDEAPGCRVLVSHLGLPGLGAATRADGFAAIDSLRTLATHPALHIKASGLYALGVLDRDEAVAPLLDTFGAARLMWGSDYPVVLDTETFERSTTLPLLASLSPQDESLIRGGTLSRLLSEVDVPPATSV